MGKLFAAALLILLVPLPTIADGTVVPEIAYPVITIPDQRALVRFENGIEQLVIETSFTGSGTNFAWIVPLPSVPEIEAAPIDLFARLQSATQPALVHDIARYYLVFLIAGVSFHLARRAVLNESTLVEDLPLCFAAAILAGVAMKSFTVAGVVLVFSVLLRSMQNKHALGAVAFFYLTFLGGFMVFQTFPLFQTMGTLEGPDGADSQVTVLGRKSVGVYDTATISAKNADALFAWLSDNGFASDRKFQPAIEKYIEENWVFVGAKVRRDSVALDKSSPTPLAFTFKTERPVYPLRLTGIGNPSCAIDLYVFGPSRAKLPHFKVELCEENKKRHVGAGFQPWAGNAPVLTRLAGDLNSSSMKEDAYFKWVPFSAKQKRLFSSSAALNIGLNIAAAMGALGWALISLSDGSWGFTEADSRRWYVILSGVALAIGGVVFLLLPKTEIYFQ